MFGSRRSRAPAAGMGGGGYGAAPPRRRGFGMGGGRRGAGSATHGRGMGAGRTGGMGMAPGGVVAPRVRTRDRIKRLFGFGRSRRRTAMY
ncbi:hypothetical protein RHS01_02558 [Rhizoctonia solani]|uniref:Uncharacterized protein n=1 Tax=Rhizoctonia solani TaxID=456999 RepID=A0A8H7M7F9_9AGAM|nr:hypothetical protein RHS01_02558 [Rhizoctonia solani]